MRRFGHDEGGQAILLVGITIMGMVMAVGLAMDAGQLYNGRRTAQEAADSAAFAGATVLYQQGTTAEATSAAIADASLNGYATDTPTSGTTVTIALPPTSGGYVGNSSCVQATISTPVRTSLVPAQASFTTVTAHSTACYIGATTGYAIVATDQSCSSGRISVGSQGDLVIHSGSIQVNSCADNGAQLNGGGSVTLDTGYETDVVGTAASGSWPSLHTSKPVVADPFAGTPKPSTSGLTTYGDPQCSPAVNQPGIYTGRTSSSCDYLFAPGTYIWKGGRVDSNGNSSLCTGDLVGTTSSTIVSAGASQTVTPLSMSNIVVGKMLAVDTGAKKETVAVSAISATTFTARFGVAHSGSWSVAGGCSIATGDGGVFFFITSSSYPSPGSSCEDAKFNGNNETRLYAPTSGTYQGLLIWVDDSCTTGVEAGGNGDVELGGAIYVPNGRVKGDGNNAKIYATQIVTKQVDQGNADFTLNYDRSQTFKGKVPATVE